MLMSIICLNIIRDSKRNIKKWIGMFKSDNAYANFTWSDCIGTCFMETNLHTKYYNKLITDEFYSGLSCVIGNTNLI